MDAKLTSLAQARNRAYSLFARLYQTGLTEHLLPLIAQIPDLAEAADLNNFDADRAGSEYYTLFGFNVFPYASVFLDERGTLGGPTSQSVLRCYQRSGFDVSLESESPDHIALQLQFLAHLCAIEAECLEDDLDRVTNSINQLQRRFIDEHVMTWLPAFVVAIRQQGNPFYSKLVDLTLEMVLHHLEALEISPVGPEADFALPSAPDLTADPKIGLKDIAAYLVIPAYSGLYLSRSDITRLGRNHSLPRGFGSRQQMLTNLLRSAADYEQIPELLEEIQGLVSEWRQSFPVQASSTSRRIARIWLDRLESTEKLLRTLTEALIEP